MHIHKYIQPQIIIIFSSPTRFGHSCEHQQGVLQQEYHKNANNCKEMYDKTTRYYTYISDITLV
jgi:hypothetical protein